MSAFWPLVRSAYSFEKGLSILQRSLFVGYSTGRLDLIDVENHQVLHTLELKSDIECLNWTQNTKESYDDLDELQGNTKLVNIPHGLLLFQLNKKLKLFFFFISKIGLLFILVW